MIEPPLALLFARPVLTNSNDSSTSSYIISRFDMFMRLFFNTRSNNGSIPLLHIMWCSISQTEHAVSHLHLVAWHRCQCTRDVLVLVLTPGPDLSPRPSRYQKSRCCQEQANRPPELPPHSATLSRRLAPSHDSTATHPSATVSILCY